MMAADVGGGDARLAGAAQSGVTWKAPEGTCRTGLTSYLGPDRPAPLAPENLPSSLRNLRGEAEAGVESAVPSSCAHWKPAVTVSREEGCSWPHSALPPRTPSFLPAPGSQACGHAQGLLEKDPSPGVRARISVGSFFRVPRPGGCPAGLLVCRAR